MKRSDKIDTQAARTRLKYELNLSRGMLAESVDVVPRFILELPDLKHMVILTNMPASGPKRDAALKLIANVLAYKMVLSFVFALETLRPDTIHAVFVAPRLRLGALQMFDRSNLDFGEVVFFDPRHTDHDIVDLFPKGRTSLTHEDELEILDFLDQQEVWSDTFILET